MNSSAEKIETLLALDTDTVTSSWESVQSWISDRFGERMGIEGVLFLIGIRDWGNGYQPDLKKEAKQDMIMHGTALVFETIGLYRRVVTEDGSPGWAQSVSIPKLPVPEQEKLLQVAIIRYLEPIILNELSNIAG